MSTTDGHCRACLCPNVREVHRDIKALGQFEPLGGYNLIRRSIFNVLWVLVEGDPNNDPLWRETGVPYHLFLLAKLVDACEEDNAFPDPWDLDEDDDDDDDPPSAAGEGPSDDGE